MHPSKIQLKKTTLSLSIGLAVACLPAYGNDRQHGQFVITNSSTPSDYNVLLPSSASPQTTDSTPKAQHGKFIIGVVKPSQAADDTSSNDHRSNAHQPNTQTPNHSHSAYQPVASANLPVATLPSPNEQGILGTGDSKHTVNTSLQTTNPQNSSYHIIQAGKQPTTDNAPSNPNTTAIERHSAQFTTRANTTNTSSLDSLSDFYQTQPAFASCQGVWQYRPTYTRTGVPSEQLFAAANYGYYNNKDYAELSGNVVLQQNNKEVVAQKIAYYPKTYQSYATGGVRFGDLLSTDTNQILNSKTLSQSDLMGIANTLAFNTQTGQTHGQDVAFASTKLHAHGYAQTLSYDKNIYTLQNTLFSTCPPNSRHWHIDAQNIRLDRDTGRGIAKNTTLNIHNIPILYLPYFNFPIDDRRATGFLTPKIGLDSESGLQLSTPYYLNLAPNYDATLTPTFYSNRNPLLQGEFRYLTTFGAGKLDAALLPSDRQYNHKDRHHLFFDHLWQVRPNLNMYATYRQVSDSKYLSDFDTLGIENNPLNLPRRIGATFSNAYLNADLRAETYQKLEGTDRFGNAILDKDRPYYRLPQLSMYYRLPSEQWQGTWQKLHIDGISNSAYFKKSINDNSDSEKSGARLYNQLNISYPMVRPWGHISPKLSLTQLYTAYDEDSLDSQQLTKKNGSRFILLPSVGVDAQMYLEKQGSPFGKLGKQGYQILSPRLKYTYTPYKDQSEMPNFETSLASMSYNQLLSDSWFLGYDRIGDLHALTPALNYRYIDGTGLTKIDASLAEQIYLTKPKVGLDDTIDFNQRSSGLAWQASFAPSRHWWLDTSGSFNPSYDLNSIIGAVRYQPYQNMLFNAGYIKRSENPALGQLPISAYTASAIYPINNKWQVVGSVQYDENFGKFMEVLTGLTYNDCCISFSIYGREYRNDLNPSQKNQAIMAELRLAGLGGGGKLAQLLTERVLGYKELQYTAK